MGIKQGDGKVSDLLGRGGKMRSELPGADPGAGCVLGRGRSGACAQRRA